MVWRHLKCSTPGSGSEEGQRLGWDKGLLGPWSTCRGASVGVQAQPHTHHHEALAQARVGVPEEGGALSSAHLLGLLYGHAVATYLMGQMQDPDLLPGPLLSWAAQPQEGSATPSAWFFAEHADLGPSAGEAPQSPSVRRPEGGLQAADHCVVCQPLSLVPRRLAAMPVGQGKAGQSLLLPALLARL